MLYEIGKIFCLVERSKGWLSLDYFITGMYFASISNQMNYITFKFIVLLFLDRNTLCWMNAPVQYRLTLKAPFMKPQKWPE